MHIRFSILMIFISFENYKDGKSIFDKTIESKIIKICIIFYYIFFSLIYDVLYL